ncbi:tannase/feruloyl esterase family alpha/beta hydrolase [Candidatus Rariloculus sp.]|uniref:tannase/feruloyl esterase family alpha/beta hydrolase n=1 Tax=Candidatus Rariloculus sp. TaxID=3101265 RepID=UPI003D0D0B4E
MTRRQELAVLALLALLAQIAPLASLAAVECGAIAELAADGMTISEAAAVPASDEVPVAHCLVRGRMAERVGTDGLPYAISFELRLPDDWTGRFAHQFNGGNDGAVVPALGRLGVLPANDGALARGFAVVSSDAGHDGSAHPEAGLVGGNVFGLEFEARRDYGYGAAATLHPAAIALTEAYYEAPVRYTYGLGSSNGGRHALVAASRMAGSFDGLVAGYPGFKLPRAALQHAWDVQTFRSVGDSLAEAFTRNELDIVAAHVLLACDGLDGLEDALVFAIDDCQTAFDPESLVCGAGEPDDCLPEPKAAALVRLLGGPRNSAGEQLYSEWDWDTGIASDGWRTWKLESPVAPWDHKPIIAVMGAGSLAQVFTTPPTLLAGDAASLEAFLMEFDFDVDAPKIDATNAAFPESAMDLMSPPDADAPTLDAFEAAGGKLIVFHGVSDPVFSFRDTANWYESLLDNNPDGAGFARFYAVPGMPHGPGGVAPDRFDILTPLIDWVERGNAPGPLVATVREDNEAASARLRGATRKLCPWPSIARYTGNEPTSSDSFGCSDAN